MMGFRRPFAAVLAIWAALAAPSSAVACGFEDPNSAALKRGGLNWSFPNALYVTSAVWQAQLAGVIPQNEAPAGVTALLGYGETVKRLGLLQSSLTGAHPAPDAPSFSLVLIGPMLWSRYIRAGDAYSAEHHIAGPSPGDVVIVSDAPVIQALVEGRLSVSAAEERGLIRYYGPKAGIVALRMVFETIRFPAGDHNKNVAAQAD